MPSHRRTRHARPVVGRIALAGVALAGLSAAPGTVAVSAPLDVAAAPAAAPAPFAAAPGQDDVLWYGLLSAAALAGAAGAHQLVGRPRRA
ncbi:hypothetical protein WCD74_11710 [Actinomycetospora sp. OC33-EN08]|uniref:LPXTG cell wall anchor domain-containing protein n=1 Tax=Actinomycetospora aurantiaca TaxID=3129233 RepID=A0ABU8MPV3_9PSEU